MQTLAAELVRFAHAATASPEMRETVAKALRMALAVVDPSLANRRRELATALDRLADELIILGDRAEWLAMNARLMTPPAPATPAPRRSTPADTSRRA